MNAVPKSSAAAFVDLINTTTTSASTTAADVQPADGSNPSDKGPAIENHQLADLGADELCTMLIAQWEDDALSELAKRINDHLEKKSTLFPKPGPEISSGATNLPPASETRTTTRRSRFSGNDTVLRPQAA